MFCWLTLGTILVILAPPPTQQQTYDMSKFNSLQEESTCSINWEHVRTLWGLSQMDKLEMFYYDSSLILDANSEWYIYRLQSPYGANPGANTPLFHMDYDNRKTVAKFDYVNAPDLFKGGYDVSKTMLFPICRASGIWLVLFTQADTGVESAVPFVHYSTNSKFYPPFAFPSGSFPLRQSEINQDINSKFELTVFGVMDGSYRSAMLRIEPTPSLDFTHRYFYCFNRALTSVFFASSIDLLRNHLKTEFMSAEQVIARDIHLQIFVYDDHIYLINGDWVLIFRHLDLDDELPKYLWGGPLFEAPITVMHRDTLFRCSRDQTRVPRPAYPVQGLIRHSAPLKIVTLVLVVFFLVVVGSIVGFFIVNKKQQQQQDPSKAQQAGGASTTGTQSSVGDSQGSGDMAPGPQKSARPTKVQFQSKI